MKKIVTLVLVAMVAMSCVFALAACAKPLEDPEFSYTITGNFNGWHVNTDAADDTKLDAKYQMEAISVNDARVKSIKGQLKDAQYLYIVEHTCVNEGAGWTITYTLSEGGREITVDGNMAIKVLKTKFTSVGDVSSWEQNWLPDAGNTNVRSLTPDTLYCPPHSESATYPGSGAWNDNPIILEAGTYYVVFATFADGTYGIAAIAK